MLENKRPPPEWPMEGNVEFHDYSVRYREGLDLVLKTLNLSVKGGEKVRRPLQHFVASAHFINAANFLNTRSSPQNILQTLIKHPMVDTSFYSLPNVVTLN